MMKILIAAVFLFALAACAPAYEPEPQPARNYAIGSFVVEQDEISPEDARERLIEQGWEEDWMDWMEADDFVRMYNQGRFMAYVDYLYEGRPLGESGEVIPSRYFGGLHFNEEGVLVVSVLPPAMQQSEIAINEMLDLGIIIRVVDFAQETLLEANNRLFDVFTEARAVGVTSSGIGMENAITVWLEPYTSEQREIFNDFLLANGFDPVMFLIEPAITEEMREWRNERIATAIATGGDLLVLVGEVEVSRTEIDFSVQNTSDENFNYGSGWDLARFENGEWIPVPNLPGEGGAITAEGHWLQGGGIQQYRINFRQRFGELMPGEYAFVRDGSVGGWDTRSYERTFVLVKFEITEETPLALSSAPRVPDIYEWPVLVQVAEVSNVTSTGMRIVVENLSEYDIEHRSQIISIIPAEHTLAGEPWEWWEHQLPFLPFDDIEDIFETDFMQAQGFIPAGESREFDIYLGNLFAELASGDYVLELSVGGNAEPPHPTGMIFDRALVAFTVE
jgi:hypothetical protein